MHTLSNTPAPDALLLTAREALKTVLRDGNTDNTYTLLMAMNAMGIAARAMSAAPSHFRYTGMDGRAFRDWVRRADARTLIEPGLVEALRRHVRDHLAVANPRFPIESAGACQ